MSRKKLSRRQFVAATALTSAAMITAPMSAAPMPPASSRSVSGTIGFPVPTRPPPTSSMPGPRRKGFEVQIDYIPSQGNKKIF